MTWRWPSTAKTCSHHQTNKSRSYDSCVLTDPPTLMIMWTVSYSPENCLRGHLIVSLISWP